MRTQDGRRFRRERGQEQRFLDGESFQASGTPRWRSAQLVRLTVSHSQAQPDVVTVSSTFSLTGWLRLLPTDRSLGGPGGSGAWETTHTQPETAPWAGPPNPPQLWA